MSDNLSDLSNLKHLQTNLFLCVFQCDFATKILCRKFFVCDFLNLAHIKVNFLYQLHVYLFARNLCLLYALHALDLLFVVLYFAKYNLQNLLRITFLNRLYGLLVAVNLLTLKKTLTNDFPSLPNVKQTKNWSVRFKKAKPRKPKKQSLLFFYYGLCFYILPFLLIKQS